MKTIDAIIEYANGETIEFENYYDGLKAYDQITNAYDFEGPLSLIDMRME